MKACSLNLLRENERVSSSPIRLRVMMPVMAMLATVGMLVWWGILYGKILNNTSSSDELNAAISSRKSDYDSVIDHLSRANELEAELEQLSFYANSRRPWGEALSSLAEIMPAKIQLLKISIPPPPPQDLSRPKGFKGPPLWGPTTSVEKVAFIISGRTPKETPVISLMEALESETFTNTFTIIKDPRDPNQSPKVRSFRQDTSGNEKSRMLSFEIEYHAKERSFQ